jgi:hypothetical protein
MCWMNWEIGHAFTFRNTGRGRAEPRNGAASLISGYETTTAVPVTSVTGVRRRVTLEWLPITGEIPSAVRSGEQAVSAAALLLHVPSSSREPGLRRGAGRGPDGGVFSAHVTGRLLFCVRTNQIPTE